MEVLFWQAAIALTIFVASFFGGVALAIVCAGWAIWTFAIANTTGLLVLQMAIVSVCGFWAAGRVIAKSKPAAAKEGAPQTAAKPSPKKLDNSWGLGAGMLAVAAIQFWPKLFAPTEPPSFPPSPPAIARPLAVIRPAPTSVAAPVSATVLPAAKRRRVAGGAIDLRGCLALASDDAVAKCAETAP